MAPWSLLAKLVVPASSAWLTRKHQTAPSHMRVNLPLVVCALSVSLCSGCAFLDDTHEDHWRRLKVLEIMRPTDLPSEVDGTCLQSGLAQERSVVAVVRYRTGRALHRHAFLLPPDSRTKVGETIEVNPRLCALRATPESK